MSERGKHVLNLSKRIIASLNPYCKKIQIAGSIRREEKNPGDIDIVLIPKDKEKLDANTINVQRVTREISKLGMQMQ